MQKEITIIEHYKKYFRTVSGDSDELKDQAYHLRYEVYHEKYGIQGVDNQESEHDHFDDSALHSLLFHQPSGTAIGYIRLIPFANQSVKRLPIEHYCKNTFDMELISLDQLRHDRTGEMSRMSIHPSFRRRGPDNSNKLVTRNTQSSNNRRFPINYLAMCITLAGLNLMISANLENAAALMERSLAVYLKRQGVAVKQIGKSITLYGHRSPYLIDTDKTYKNIKPEFFELFHLIADEYAANNMES